MRRKSSCSFHASRISLGLHDLRLRQVHALGDAHAASSVRPVCARVQDCLIRGLGASLMTSAAISTCALHAIHGDLGNVDIGSVNHDMGTAEVAVGRIGRLKRALIRACT